MSEKTLLDFWGETEEKMLKQLESDQKRWGDTWKKRSVEGQEERVFARFRDYYDQFANAGVPIPWEKIIGEVHICMTRVAHPEELE
jgi:hypothetical protein